MSTSFITPGHVRAFQAVTTQLYGEVTLARCLINGKPGVGEGKIGVTSPLRRGWTSLSKAKSVAAAAKVVVLVASSRMPKT